MNPQLYVFAGPNGAGKSTLSASMLDEGTPVFDGDKEFARLRQLFDTTDSGDLYDAVNGHVFDNWKTAQIELKRDCAFETNFRSAEVMNSVNLFKQQGYEVHLLFFGLETIVASVDRVKLRVAGGGHFVSLENIKANYTEGLKNLGRFFRDFDSVSLLHNFAARANEAQIKPVMKIEKGLVIEQAAGQPDWVQQFTKKFLSQGKRKGLGL
jgi:predicted ABC-type ATPase